MKLATLIFLSTAVFTFNVFAQDQAEPEGSVAVIDAYPNLFQYQNFYLSGQPSLDALHWLKSQGVTKIVNVRTESENLRFTEEAYNEAAMAEKMGFEYKHLPISGGSDYSPEKLKELSGLLEGEEKILFHCRSAGRVTNFFMAYLVRSEGYSIDEAVAVGKELKFSFRLEQILDAEIHMEEK